MINSRKHVRQPSEGSPKVPEQRQARRNLQIGDTVNVDTPLLNGVAIITDGPSTVRGTKVLPKWEFTFTRGIVLNPEAGFAGDITGETVWMEDNPDYIDITEEA